MFNNLLHNIMKGETMSPDEINFLGKLRIKEATEQEEINRLVGIKKGLEPSWLLKSRKKRVDEVRKGKANLS